MDKLQIKKLAIAAFKAKRFYNCLGMCGVPQGLDEQIEQSVLYEQARADWMEAARKLRLAQAGL